MKNLIFAFIVLVSRFAFSATVERILVTVSDGTVDPTVTNAFVTVVTGVVTSAYITDRIGDIKNDRIVSEDGLSVIDATGRWMIRTNSTEGIAVTNTIASVSWVEGKGYIEKDSTSGWNSVFATNLAEKITNVLHKVAYTGNYSDLTGGHGRYTDNEAASVVSSTVNKVYIDGKISYLTSASLSSDQKTLYITNSAGDGISFQGGGDGGSIPSPTSEQSTALSELGLTTTGGIGALLLALVAVVNKLRKRAYIKVIDGIPYACDDGEL